MKKEKLSTIIKRARENKQISQRELARRIKVDNAEISRIEKGTRIKPGVMVLKKLAKELDLDIVMLMEISNYDNEEIEMFGINGANYTEEIYSKAFYRMEDYVREEDGIRRIDLIKTLKGYKKGDINEAEVMANIWMCTGVDVRECLFKDQQKYLEGFETEHIKYDKK